MADQDDLTATKTEGFKVGEKKTLQEYQELGMYMFLNLFLSIPRPTPPPYLPRPSTPPLSTMFPC